MSEFDIGVRVRTHMGLGTIVRVDDVEEFFLPYIVKLDNGIVGDFSFDELERVSPFAEADDARG